VTHLFLLPIQKKKKNLVFPITFFFTVEIIIQERKRQKTRVSASKRGKEKKKEKKKRRRKRNHDKHPVSRIWPVSEGGVQLALAAVPSFLF
jgi:hypothetical protein